MKIRTQIFLLFGTFFIFLIAVLFALNLVWVRRELHKQAKQDLIKIHDLVVSSTESLLSTAIESYLRGITETEMETVRYYYNQFKTGGMSEQEAMDSLQEQLNLKKVGETGYMAGVGRRDNRLFLDIHPVQRGLDCSETEGCTAWDSVSNGIVEYDWKNPDDLTKRTKVAYVEEFKPWNLIIGASSYKDEFISLVDIDELREMIKPIRILKTGYFYVMDLEKDLFLIHPELEGRHPNDMYGVDGETIVSKLMRSADGWTSYLWKNPSEKKYREKYSYMTKLDWYNWHIVSSGYSEEIYDPISFLKRVTVWISLVSTVLLFILIGWLSRIITKPLEEIQGGIISFYKNQIPFSMRRQSVKEIEFLAHEVSEMTESISNLISENRSTLSSLDKIINVMPSMIATVDKEGKILLSNDIFSSSVGYDESRPETVMTLLPELKPYQALLWRVLNENSIETVTYPVGEEPYLREHELTIVPLFDGAATNALIRIDDITDRLEMERKLHQSQKMEAVGQLAGGIAHDFNNVLAGIVGASELLAEADNLTQEQKMFISLILTATDRAADLTKKLLTFSRRGTTAAEPFSVNRVVGETVELLRHTIDKSIDISVEERAGDVAVIGDKSVVQNIFMNIAINASHAMSDGGVLTFTVSTVELSTEYCEHSPFNIFPGHFVEIAIRDTGCGIAPEALSHIFEPFFTTKKEGKGTGLGLATVYGAIQDHQGAITVYSEVGTGTVFYIYLPLTGSVELADAEQIFVPTGSETILVIDDEQLIRSTAQALLVSMGYTVILAENGEDGVALFNEMRDRIDLVILDMIMPVMGGRETFAKLRELSSEIPVIISSGFAKEKDLEELRNQNVAGFLNKPFRKIQLAEKVKKALEERIG